MRDGTTTATFTVPKLTNTAKITVIDENRTITPKDGTFTDTFAPWDVHLYKIDSL